jgi:hypothetical protein
MRTLVLLRHTCLVISALSMAVAFLARGYWAIVVVLLTQMAFWFALRRQSVQWRSSCLLVIYVALAVVGILLGLAVALLLVGTLAALAAWDLLNFGETLKDASGPACVDLLAKSHLRSLALAVTIGALLSAAGLALDLDLPYAVVGALALALVAGLARASEHLWRASD